MNVFLRTTINTDALYYVKIGILSSILKICDGTSDISFAQKLHSECQANTTVPSEYQDVSIRQLFKKI